MAQKECGSSVYIQTREEIFGRIGGLGLMRVSCLFISKKTSNNAVMSLKVDGPEQLVHKL